MSSNSERSADLAAERHYVAGLYSMLDAKCAEAEALVDVELRRGADSGLWQRDVAVAHWSRRSAQFGAAENGLCFGAMHSSDGIRSYIGRIGLFDDAVKEPLLIDWRAPAARPFYCATAVRPEGIERRRHFHTSGRTLLDFHDNVLSGAADTGGIPSALFSALEAPRGAAMRDIVSTIQAEQDEIIRLDHQGVLVVEGGPGTGKPPSRCTGSRFCCTSKGKRLPGAECWSSDRTPDS